MGEVVAEGGVGGYSSDPSPYDPEGPSPDGPEAVRKSRVRVPARQESGPPVKNTNQVCVTLNSPIISIS
jgi:hypothetical protein